MEFSSDCSYIFQDTIEKAYFDDLWDVANNRQMGNAGGEVLSEIAAVTFFQRSGVDKGSLKQIWSLSTPSATMNLQQFYVALRFIALIQTPGALPISKEKFLSTLKERLGLPKFVGIDLPVIKPSTTGVPAIPAAFAISPQEHLKYHTLFLQYDTNKDGFLSREETIPIFMQSELDSQSVELIWAVADDDRDGKLTPKEFCAAFHIIVCVTKRQQPVPTSLPISLKGFLVYAPAVPRVDESIPLAQPPVSVVAPTVAPLTIMATVPISAAPSIVQVQPVVSSAPPAQLKTVSAAFDDFDSMKPVAVPIQSIMTKIALVEALLGSFARYPLISNEERVASLSRNFPEDLLYTYVTFTSQELKELLFKQQDEKNLLLQQSAAAPPVLPQNELLTRVELLEKRLEVGQDPRMYFFSRLMKPSSGKHSLASKKLVEIYHLKRCIVCGETENVTMAHIVAGNKSTCYGSFSTPTYIDDLDVKSPRNFLLLCGSEGAEGTCHNEFDKYLLTLWYNTFSKKYRVMSLNKNWKRYADFHNIELILPHQPYRRLLAWRTRYCFQINSFLLAGTNVTELVNSLNLSEESHSIAEPSNIEGEIVDTSTIGSNSD